MENNTDKSASTILLEAADLLTEENSWHKGAYFKAAENSPLGCSMCAHGAIAYAGNPEVRNKIKDELMGVATWLSWEPARSAMSAASDGTSAASAAAYYQNLAARENLTVEQYLVNHHGQTGLAHYKAAQAGLTISYNDNSNTTQQDVINKLREAALQ